MDEKQPIIIKGRTINRERTSTEVSEPDALHILTTSSYTPSSPIRRRNMEGITQPSFRRRSPRGEAVDEITSPSFRRRPLRGGDMEGVIRPSFRRRSPYRRNTEEVIQATSLLRKVAISVLIVMIVLLLKTIKLPFTEGIVDQVRTAITHDFDYNETIGQLKFVSDYMTDIKAVFGHDSSLQTTSDNVQDSNIVFSAPIKGEVIRLFNEHVSLGEGFDNQGIDISAAEHAAFYSSADGLVAAIEDHEIYGKSIWIKHSDNTFSFYGNCDQVNVEIGQNVKNGNKLGNVKVLEIGQSVLHFQIWIDDQPVDPLTLINDTGKVTKQEGV